MDGYIRLIYVQENTPTGRLIQEATGGQWSHVGIITPAGILEAVPPRVTISAADRYDYDKETYPATKIQDVYVADMDAARATMRSMVGKPYRTLSCLSGGAHDVLGVDISIPGIPGVDCCQMAIDVERSGTTDPEPSIPSDCWTPQHLFAANELLANPL